MGQYSQVGANDWLPTKEYSNVYDFIQNVAITKGTHAFKFGAEVKPIGFPFFQVPFPHGEMNFSRVETAEPIPGTPSATTGDSFASFLLGALDNGQISTTNFVSSTRQSYDFYAQDDWKVTPKLTVNYGLRYELWSPIGEQWGRQSNFDINTLTLQIPNGPSSNAPLPPNFNTPYTFDGVTYPADFPNVKVCRGCVSQYLIPWDKHDFGPRLGFAYNVRQKTVIRAAYGIFYGGEEQQGGNPSRGESAPFNESPQLNRPSGVSEFEPDPFFANGSPIGGDQHWLSLDGIHDLSGKFSAVPGSGGRLPQPDGAEMERRGAAGFGAPVGPRSGVPGQPLVASALTARRQSVSEPGDDEYKHQL